MVYQSFDTDAMSRSIHPPKNQLLNTQAETNNHEYSTECSARLHAMQRSTETSKIKNKNVIYSAKNTHGEKYNKTAGLYDRSIEASHEDDISEVRNAILIKQ